jgi:glycine/D-amino acid oxidase-like deaminating enzyme/nitrite reductase/ring-hydroxylating ferredoxin subunit
MIRDISGIYRSTKIRMINMAEGNVSKHGVPGSPESYWIASTPDTDYPALEGDLKVDVAVVGGGISGITTALLLKKSGLKVAVVEAGKIARGVTGYTTAHISSSQGYYYKSLIDNYGERKARQCADSCEASIGLIASLVKDYGIDCGFERRPEYMYAVSPADADRLKVEMEAEKRLGLPVSFVGTAPLPFEHYGAVRFTSQAQFHPRKYLLPLAKAIQGEGSHVFEGTRALDIDETEPCCRVKTNRGAIAANDVVLATHVPFTNMDLVPARIKPIMSYVLGVRLDEEISGDMFYSTEEPCHYIRTQPMPGGPLVIVGGEDDPVGHVIRTGEKYRKLEQFCRSHFKVKSIDYSWSTHDNYTFDAVPFIGRYTTSKHIYVATGFKGTGMTYGTVAAMVLADQITGKESPYGDVYSLSRVELPGAADFIKSQAHIVEMFVKERMERPEDLSKIPPGASGLAEVGGHKAAVYKDESGNVHAVSPRCTHMGCYVQWNDAEHTWDCPCHGSRFKADGTVFHAPAVHDLQRRDGEK